MTLLRKVLVAVLGGALLLAGVAMLVLPGPAVVVIPAALAILAVEFLWARRWLARLREQLGRSRRPPRTGNALSRESWAPRAPTARGWAEPERKI
jgi:hypothetical protein